MLTVVKRSLVKINKVEIGKGQAATCGAADGDLLWEGAIENDGEQQRITFG
jgi:hypothetical protein